MKKLCALMLVVVMALGMLPFAVSADETWSYTLVDGVLTITGTGAVGTTTTQEAEYPWHEQRAEITEIVVSDGITELGARPFSNCTALTKITFGKDCVKFSQDTMSYCPALEEVVFNGAVESIGQGIVYSTGNITKVTITNQSKEDFIALTQAKPYNTNFEKDTITWTVNG
ncbi:MAG: leucine-rich repeat protein, partial [Clostridia bacterium]|nr:leucine-rich repeat protein [Clostridia bacterium]